MANFTVTAQDPQGASAQMPVNLAIEPQPANGLSLGAKVGIGVGAGLGLAGVGALGFGLFAHLTGKRQNVQKTPEKYVELNEVDIEPNGEVDIEQDIEIDAERDIDVDVEQNTDFKL